MFKNLFDLSIKRSGIQIFGFYLFYSFTGALISGILCGCFISIVYPEAVSFDDALNLGLFYGPCFVLLYGVILALLIIASKGIFNSFKALLLTIISVPLLYFCGASLGMIPIAFLTTFNSEKSNI